MNDPKIQNAAHYASSVSSPSSAAGAAGGGGGGGLEVLLAAREADEPPLFLSLELSKLWKKFCRTSCCVCPPAPGLGDVDNVGDDACDRPLGAPAPGTDSPPVGRFALRLRPLRASGPAEEPSDEGPPVPPSISVSARSTLGSVKLLLPIGPTTPAEGFSVGFRKDARGSRSAFFEFSS